MSEKSLRGAGPGAGQGRDPAAPGGERSPDSGATPGDPRPGDRTDRVSGRDASGPRVALVPPPASDGIIDALASTAETRRVVDIGRTTLMGVPSPLADREKSTSPGHDVHLPSEKGRVADARPVATSGVIPSVELDGSSTRRIGKIESPTMIAATYPTPEAKPGSSDRKEAREGQGSKGSKEADGRKAAPGEAGMSERTIAAAAATFRAAAIAADQPKTGRPREENPLDRSTERGGWGADRTREYRLDGEAPKGAFATALLVGMAMAVGLGILVQTFIHSRVRANAMRAAVVAPPSPRAFQFPKPALPPEPAPAPEPAAVTPELPPSGSPQPDTTGGPGLEAAGPTPEAVPGPDDRTDGSKLDRRLVVRPKAGAPAGRVLPPGRIARVSPPGVRPAGEPVGPATTNVPATQPSPLSTAPPPAAVAAPKAEGSKADSPAKPYDPDMPLPPSME